MIRNIYVFLIATIILLLNGICVFSQKTLIDYFLPMEPRSALVSKGTWGEIVPRDTTNGLEGKSIYDPKTGKYLVKDWCYWDGSIVKDDDGKYHMYASYNFV